MSFSQNDIDAKVAHVISADSSQEVDHCARVLVVSRTPEIGQTMAAEMAQEATVEGLIARGSLSSVLSAQDYDWTTLEVVVFEISPDVADDVQAIDVAHNRPGVAVHFIAVSTEPVSEDTRQMLDAAGVREAMCVSIDHIAKVPSDSPPMPEPAEGIDIENITKALENDAEMELAQASDEADAEIPDDTVAVLAAPLDKAADADRVQTGQVTAFLHARGGVGASTLAVNLALASAEEDSPGRVALVDLDIQNGAVNLMLNLPESEHVSALIRGRTLPDATFLDKAMSRHESGLDVLAAPDVFAPAQALTPEVVVDLLDALKARYDHIFLDMPQGMADWFGPVATGTFRAVLVSDTSVPSVKHTRRLVDMLEEQHPGLTLEVVINQHKRPLAMSATLKEMEHQMGRPLDHWVPIDVKAARRAVDVGQPVITHARRSPLALSIHALSDAFFDKKPID